MKKFKRQTSVKHYTPFFILACEGSKTEREYLLHINRLLGNSANIKVVCWGYAPATLAQKLTGYLKNNKLGSQDEAWLVFDEDNWSEGKNKNECEVNDFLKLNTKQHFKALSIPKFESWLLLHFSDGNGVYDSTSLDKEYAQYVNGEDKKGINTSLFNIDNIRSASSRAKQKNNSELFIKTEVYKLVDKLFTLLDKSDTSKLR